MPDVDNHFNESKQPEQQQHSPQKTPEKCDPTFVPKTPSGLASGPKFSLMESPPEGISERPIDVGWVGSWATDFDALLADPIGVKAFKDFLSREFSAENLSFFLSCRQLAEQSGDLLSSSIEHIYHTYLSHNATDSVNVDSTARKQIDAAFASGQRHSKIFAPSEKQVKKKEIKINNLI